MCTNYPCDLIHATGNYCESNPKTCEVLMPSQAWNWRWNEENCNWSIARTSIYTLTFKNEIACLQALSPTSILCFSKLFFAGNLTKLNSLPEPQINTVGVIHGLKAGTYVKLSFRLESFKMYQNNGIFSFCTISNPYQKHYVYLVIVVCQAQSWLGNLCSHFV